MAVSLGKIHTIYWINLVYIPTFLTYVYSALGLNNPDKWTLLEYFGTSIGAGKLLRQLQCGC